MTLDLLTYLSKSEDLYLFNDTFINWSLNPFLSLTDKFWQQSIYKWIYLFGNITGEVGANIVCNWFNAKVNLIPSIYCSPKSFIG